ncbi:MAG: FAD-dependent oxidoreductase [Pseudomonadales bacterium]|nr:FAD-dependent oxidoreductase [Pseudomonadales bacterium]
MSHSAVGTEKSPLRVAIIGSGPAGFYVVSNFLKHRDLHVTMDMFERLPTPFGLVRAGVAPDHQKYKSVTRVYDRSAKNDNYRFFGNVTYGEHISLEDLKQHYHQIIFTTGAQTDRSLGVPGESLVGSHSATDFVAWYNGHPDYVDCQFDLSQKEVVIVGLGNVAVDVARILCKTENELKHTDIADYALTALKSSHVKNVTILGRRGPAQAAFTPPEIREMGELEDADVSVSYNEAHIDETSRRLLEASGDKNTKKNVAIIEEFSEWHAHEKSKQLTIRFLVSPTEIVGDDEGHVTGIKLVKNETYLDEDGAIKARAIGEEETLPAGLVFRSVGYRGVPLPDIPFNEAKGIIFNHEGRVTDADGVVQTGLYVAGWIKRGPTGVIGTNKTDAKETVDHMVEDVKRGVTFEPASSDYEATKAFIFSRQKDAITYDDWTQLDQKEIESGIKEERPRVKFTALSEMLDVLER